MNNDRLRKALKRVQIILDNERYTDGLLGRPRPGSDPEFVPRGLARHKYVRINNSNGSQSVVRARDDIGVPESYGLPVRLRIIDGVNNSGVATYAIERVLRDESLATVDPPAPGGVPAHTHDDRYYRENEHINVSVGAADAGKPIVLDAGGKLDASLIDSEDVADIVGAMVTGNTETDIAVTYQDADNTLDFVFSPTLVADRISAASTDDTIQDADLWGYVTGGVLVKTAWSNIKSVFKTYYDSVAATLTNKTLDSTNISALTAKNPPVDADSAVIVDSAASNVFKRVTYTNIKAFLKTYFDTLYELAGAIATHAALTVTHGATGAIVGTTNTQTLTNKTLTAPIIDTVAGGTAANDDLTLQGTTNATRTTSYVHIQPTAGLVQIGPGTGTDRVHVFHSVDGGITVEHDDVGNESPWYSVKKGSNRQFWAMAGAASSFLAGSALGDMVFRGMNGKSILFGIDNGLGTASPGAALTATGLGVGTTSPQSKFHVHDGSTGFMVVSKTAIVGVAQTIIPDGTGDVTLGCIVRGIARNTTPGIAKVDTTVIAPGGTADVVIGADTLRFAVSAGGALTVIRQAGTATWQIGVTVEWM